MVQGASEALPISSTAHLGMVRDMRGDHLDLDAAKSLDVALHLGSLAGPAMALRGRGPIVPTLVAATLASLPAAIVGAAMRPTIIRRLGKPVPTAVLGAAAAFAVWRVDRRSVPGRAARLEDLSLDDLMAMGVAQAAALVPGVSRSGVVYAAGRSRGLDRDSAATAAIAMSVPVIAGAGLLTTVSGSARLRDVGASGAVGTAVAAGAAALAGPYAHVALTKGSGRFAIYRAALACAVLSQQRHRKEVP